MADENDISINIGSDPSGVEAGSRRARSAVKGVQDEAKQLDSAFRRLKSSIDPTFAAQERYNKSMADANRLMNAGRINKREFAAATNAAKAALDQEIASIERNSVAGKAAAAEATRMKRQQTAEARAAALEESRAAREASQARIAAARQAAAAVEAAQRREQAAITLSAQLARQAARDAQRASTATAGKRATQGVAPGSIDTSRTVGQLTNDIKRATDASARAAERAVQYAAQAASAADAKTAASAERAAQRAQASAEQYSARAIQLRRTLASVEGQTAAEAAAADKAARDAQKAAARDAAQAAATAAQQKREAERQATAAARDAAEAARRAAIAERQQAQAAHELRASIDPVYAAQMRYNQTMQTATQLLMQGKLQQGEFTRIMAAAKAQMDVNTRSLGRQNTMYVQLGYQAQDVTASLASGINPLVILAQQGGQTAAALSTMGGTVGRVAAFMAGPWGAAIIGFTLLIGLMLGKSKEAKEATVDLTNAESRRAASLPKLTDAIKEFNDAQRESNNLESESLRLKNVGINQTIDETQKKLNDAQKELKRLKDQWDMLIANPSEGQEGALAVLGFQIGRAETKVKDLQKALGDLRQNSQGELEITGAMRDAEAATDANTAAQQRYEREASAAQNTYRAARAAALRIGDAKARENALDAAKLALTNSITTAIRRRVAAEEAASAAKRAADNPNGEGVSSFKSRQQAISIAGRELQGQRLSVTENPLFGGITAGAHRSGHQNAIDVNIPGAGNEAANAGTRERFDELARSYQARGYRVLWNGRVYEAGGNGPGPLIPKRTGTAGEQHTNHMHIEAPASIVGKPVASGTTTEAFNQWKEQQAAEKEARKEALQAQVEDYDYQKTLAEDNYAEQVRIQGLKIEAIRAYYGAESRETIRAQRELAQMEQRHNREMLRMKLENVRAQEELATMRANADREAADANISQRNANVDFRQSVGVINPRQALEERRAIIAEQYAMEEEFENRLYQLKLQSLRDQLALLPAESTERVALNNSIEQLELQHQINMRSIQRGQVTAMGEINRQVATDTVNKYREITDTIGQGLSSTFQGLWTRQQTFWQGMINLADQVVYKFADMGIKMLTDWLTRELSMTAITQAQEGVRTASVITGQAVQTGAAVSGAAARGVASSAAATTEIANNAAVAATGAYKSTVVIPFIGPVAAPAAAALALAAVMGFGALIKSAAGGYGQVPADGTITELHKDEMVLPAWIASPLRNTLSGVGPRGSLSGMMPGIVNQVDSRSATHGGGDNNFYYQPQHTNGPGTTLDDLLRREGATMKKWFKNQMRNNRFEMGRN